MTIRKTVLIPSLLLLASVAYLAFRPYAQPAPPASMPVARSAPAAPAADGRRDNAPASAAHADANVPAAMMHVVKTAARDASNAVAPTFATHAPVDVARVLANAGPVPALTTMGPVPAEGSGQYGAPDRLSARRVSANRADSPDQNRDQNVKSGDAVRIGYRMYELMSGREVESSPPEGILVRVGTGIEDGAAAAVNRVPRGVAESLSHARIGDVVEVILPKDTKDLPPDLDQTAAHKIHITVLGRY